ncbi:MAG: DUF1071 domain-containing protein [Candidatus Fonsibacter lacus]|nr:DUF1071 domain-containing protein [Candidatus Fonsibacter lacus]
MSELLKINVNDHTERKGNLTYLSWAWAWAEVLKIDSAARWTAHEYNERPAMYLPDGTAMVKVSVEIKGDIKTCVLPVMDNRNRAIQNPDAFSVNTAIMRCLAKCIAMFGLGLYIYAGEDLPEGSAPQVDPDLINLIAGANSLDELTKLFKRLTKEQRMTHIDAFTARKKELTTPPEAA